MRSRLLFAVISTTFALTACAPPPSPAVAAVAEPDLEMAVYDAPGGSAQQLRSVLQQAAPSAIDPGWLEAPGLVARGAGVSGDSPVTVLGAGAAMRVPTKDPSVVFYLVGSTSVIEP